MTETQPSNQELSLAAAVFTIFLCVIFGSNAVAVKLAFSGMGVFTTAFIRFAVAAGVVFLWARFTGRSIALKKGQIHQVLIFSVLFTVQLSLFYLGLSKSNASRGALLSNLLPFFEVEIEFEVEVEYPPLYHQMNLLICLQVIA